MRKGNNPQKNILTSKENFLHRIIIPVHIPNQLGYYKESFAVFKFSMDSLLKTTPSSSAITIVNNGCCKEVCDYINGLFATKDINEIIHTDEIGKVNSILKSLRSSTEPYITITDADILFKENWLSKTVQVFNTFPKAGVVGVIPQFKMYEYFGYNVIFDNLFNSDLKYTKVKDVDGLKHFYKSVGWKDNYNKNYLNYNLSIKKNNTRALVGSGHCIATYKRTLFDNNLEFSKFALGGDSEQKYLDEPCVRKDLWRLTTDENLAYHMGNTLDASSKKYAEQLKENKSALDFNIFREPKFFLQIKFIFKNKVARRFFKNKRVKFLFYRMKGLPKEMIKNY